MPAGRPSLYSEDLAQRICDQIALNTKGIEAICDDHDDFPDGTVVRRWILHNEAFRAKYACAKEMQMELMAGEILTIADDGSNDTYTEEVSPGVVVTRTDHDVINRSRLRVDTRKWLMSKLAPKKYGDSQALKISDPDGKPLVFQVKRVDQE